MSFPFSGGCFCISLLAVASCCFAAPAFGQKLGQIAAQSGVQPALQTIDSQAADTAPPQEKKPETDKAKAMAARPAQPPPVLQQLNSAIEQLTARISPAVVQILVTGYGAVEENSRGRTALVSRERAIGSGVIVDPEGYIITNAHVVEGAQTIHVALPMPSVDHPEQIAPIGKQRVVDARLVGLHKDTDLALLKIDQTGLPTLSLGSHRPVHQGELVFALGSPE